MYSLFMVNNSSLRFSCHRNRIGDTRPGVSSDGYIGSCKTDEEAQAETVKRNQLFAAEQERMLREEGRVWMPIPGREHSWFWGKPAPKYTSYCD